MGTDYAAPTGTPVHAAGDGLVSFAGRHGGYGNAVVLGHGNGVSTLYGHMSRFAKHIRAGTRVQQGDVIGYVGMTGLATGPHLHYEYLVNGVHKNPQTVHLPGAEPLHAETLQKFRRLTVPLLADLSPPQAAPTTAFAALAPAAGPLADEPPASSVFSVSSVLAGSSFALGNARSPMAID
jgi:murein DD-endopeptidase MepM/ murein hydrolase activator NlpD